LWLWCLEAGSFQDVCVDVDLVMTLNEDFLVRCPFLCFLFAVSVSCGYARFSFLVLVSFFCSCYHQFQSPLYPIYHIPTSVILLPLLLLLIITSCTQNTIYHIHTPVTTRYIQYTFYAYVFIHTYIHTYCTSLFRQCWHEGMGEGNKGKGKGEDSAICTYYVLYFMYVLLDG
jgi:hypothetical protein